METKAWFRSKVFWLNVLTIASLALALPDVVAIIPVAATPYIGAFNAIVNLVLRFNTGVPLGSQDRK